MKIEIVAIGDEILLGNTVNTNAAFLSKELQKLGFCVTGHTVLSDNETSLKKGLKDAIEESDLVIATGGLGPTFDDKTKKVAAELFDISLEYDEDLAAELFQKFEENKYKKEQATIPKGAVILKNKIGTAPGFIFEKDSHVLILLPGVPHEMEEMFFSSLVEFLKKRFKLKSKIFYDSLNICLKKEDDVEPWLERLRDLNKEVDIGIYPQLAMVKVGFSCKEEDEKKAKDKILPLKKILEKEFKDYIFPSEKGDLAEALRDSFILKGKSLALAESCTGGAISSALTALPNTSLYYLGSIVSYSSDLKKNILHVKEKTIEKYGAVSLETVSEMVKGLFDITSADYALSISGIAGPGGGTALKPVGTVCFALGERGKLIDKGIISIPVNKAHPSFEDRSFIIKYSVSFALSLIWVRINHNLTYFSS